MKTSELTKKIREIGYEYKLLECYLKIFISKTDLLNDEHYLNVNINQTIEGIQIRNGMSISSHMARDVVRLILEYLDTPIEEREDEKYYYLRLPKGFSENYLSLYNDTNLYTFTYKAYDNSVAYNSIFTQKEIDAMPFDTSSFIKEEVQ